MPNLPSSHWTDDSGWVFVDAISEVLIADLHERVRQADFSTVTIDDHVHSEWAACPRVHSPEAARARYRCCDLGAKFAPFMEPIHCCAHRSAFVSSQLEQAPYFKQIEALLKAVNTFYCISLKRKEELRAFQEAVRCEKLNVLSVSDTRWMSVYACMTQLVRSYPAYAQARRLGADFP